MNSGIKVQVARLLLVIQSALASGRRAKDKDLPLPEKKTSTRIFQNLSVFESGIMRYRSKGVVQVGGAQTGATWIKYPGNGTLCRSQGKRITASEEPK